MSNLLTPYVTPSVLKMAATGVSWDTIPSTYQGQSKDAAILDICWRATSEVDNYCEIPLRATINTQQLEAPSFYVPVNQSNGTTRITLSRPPIISVSAITVVGVADFTSTPTTVTSTDYRILDPLMGEYGSLAPDSSGVLPNAIRMAPGWCDWTLGRGGFLVTVTYVNGWPHAGLTAVSAGGSTTLSVDDCTGMTGMALTIKDGANTEVVQIASASATSGAGTLTLKSATSTQYAHNPGVVVSTLPGVVEKAAIKFANEEALQRGAMTISAQTTPGSFQTSGASKATSLTEQAHKLLHGFKRVI